jgi:hypothetical protein
MTDISTERTAEETVRNHILCDGIFMGPNSLEVYTRINAQGIKSLYVKPEAFTSLADTWESMLLALDYVLHFDCFNKTPDFAFPWAIALTDTKGHKWFIDSKHHRKEYEVTQ